MVSPNLALSRPSWKVKLKALWETTVPLHAVFGLSATLAAGILALSGWPTLSQVGWLVLALISGRAAGFGFNRVIDAEWDKQNPRGRNRPIPTGRLTKRETLIFSFLAVGVLAWAGYRLNPITLYFVAIPVLGFVVYSYAKYHTWWVHFIQIWPQSMGPLGAWLALTGTITGPAVLFALGYGLWVAASDILIHAADGPAQVRAGVHSAVTRWGLPRALWISRGSHAVAFLLFVAAGLWLHLNPAYNGFLFFTVPILLYQHWLVRADQVDIGRAVAAFNSNAWVGPLILLGAWAGVAG
ncbi:MAG: UbiA family prenyltransferase [Clostridiales bacterium]|nr:UbiA family prenyltransferase [Clostridiales bacterium]